MKANLEPADLEDIKIEDQATIDCFAQVMAFTEEQDRVIKKQLETLLKQTGAENNLSGYKSSSFTIPRNIFLERSPLYGVD